MKPRGVKCVAGAIGIPSIGVDGGKCDLSIILCWLWVRTGTGCPGDCDINDLFDVEERSLRRNFARRFWNQTYDLHGNTSRWGKIIKEPKNYPEFFFEFYLNSSFTQSNFWRQLLSHKRIWIMCTFEYFFQCIQLTAWERCSIASWLFRWIHHATAVWCLIQMITRIRLFCEIKSRNNVALIKLCCPRYNETHSQVCTTLFNNDDFV